MKKFNFFTALIGFVCCLSCSNKNAYADQGLNPNVEYIDYELIDPEHFFELDFRGEIPEPDSIPGKVDLTLNGGSSGQSSSVIPGLKDLSEYKTKYNTQRMSVSEYLETLNKNKKENRKIIYANSSNSNISQDQNDGKDLTIEDWGPVNSVPGELPQVQFYVEFSLPVQTLKTLDDQDKINKDGKNFFTISPEVKGNYRWLGTKTLTFEAIDTLDPCVSYEIKVNPDVKSTSGKKLKEAKTFSTKTAEARIVSLNPGSTKENQNVTYSADSGLPTEIAKNSKINFNYYFSADELYNRISILTDKPNMHELSFTLTGEFDSNLAKVSNDKKKTNTYYAFINDTLHEEATIYIKFNTGNRVLTESYKTLVPFKVTKIEEYSSFGYGSGVKFYFNQNVNEETLQTAFTSSSGELAKDNFNCWANSVTITDLKSKPGEEVTVSVNKNLKNVFGYNLTNTDSITFKTKDYQGYARYIESGNAIMEAQFPHKLLFEYMNATEGAWRIKKTSTPLEESSWNSRFKAGDSGSNWIDVSTKNTRQFVEIDLEPYLVNGKGSVCFEADIYVKGTNWRGEDSIDRNTNYLNVQVTDLAATARFAINKAVIMVRSMEHNTPVSNAKVFITNKYNELHTQTAITDENGCAVINLTPSDQKMFKEWRDQRGVIVNIETSDDKVMFVASTHSSWRSNVTTDDLAGALKTHQKTFMFCDRGVYKPGETVTFKGIDKDQQLGTFIPYKNSPYKVTLEQRSWRGNTTYDSSNGTTTESGGFWGSFKIPENLKPGEYCVTYTRENSPDSYKSLYFTVAFFEPLKFQVSAEIKNKTAYAGDILNADVSASYLAGGTLAGAAYSTTWYTEPTRFSSDRPELKGYNFGIKDNYDYRRSISESSGILTKDGTTKLSCATGDDLKSIPYTYRAETYITDVSNQRIAATATKIVHPALFYVGLAKPKNKRGFAKTGETLNIPYALVGADKFILSDTKNVLGSLEYELSREYWTYNYQNSVNNNVYSRYEKHIDIEKTGSVSASTQGTISINPKNSGWYTLRVTGTDKQNRKAATDYEFYVTGSDSSGFNSSNSDELVLTPDQSLYNPGDTAQILLESPLKAGDYLITVEREGIFSEEVRHFDEPCSVIDVQIARNYVPIVYVSISSYSVRSGEPTHEYGERDLDKPKGYYGVTALFINNRVRAFSVKAETDKKVYKPGDTATVTLYATKNNKPVENAEITCFAADRAVLDLIDYHVPNPIEFFYSRYNFPLRVVGGDSRNYIMDPVTYSIKKLQGGDAMAGAASSDKDENERKDFRPTAFFEPQLVTDKNGKVTFTFKVPDNLTTFRLTAFGVKDELLALQEDEFAVQNPINVQSVQPRRLRVRDTAECGVVITNLDNVAHDVSISIAIQQAKQSKSDSKSGLITTQGKAFVDGKDSHTVKVAAGGSTVVYFDVAAESEGNIELVYTVKSDIINEKLVSKIQIEKTYCFETVSLKGSTEYAENDTKTAKELIQIPSWAKDGQGSLKVTLDATQLGILGGAVNYVFDYPYGCMEQQSSKIIPLVAFDKYIDIFGLDNKISNPHSLVVKYFNDWKDIQHKNGGFPYWPDDTKNESLYVSIRIAHIYAMALKRGYTSSELAINIANLKRFIKNNIDDKQDDLIKSYACYVFSLLKDSSLDQTLNKLEESAKTDLDIASYCGLAWANKETSSAIEKAKSFQKIIKPYLRPELRSVDITQPANTKWYWYRHYTDQNALILQLFVTLNPNDEMVDRLLYSLLQDQRDGYWQSTVTTAKVLEAIYTLIKERKLDTTNFIAKAELMQKEIISGNFKGVASKSIAKTEDFNSSLMKSLPRDKDIELGFNANGTGTLYYSADLKYALPDEIQNKRNQGLEVTYKLSEYDSQKEISTNNLLVPLETGKTYKVSVTLSTTKDRDYVALRIPIPSGAEILDSTFKTSGSEANIETTNEDSYGWWWSTWSSQAIYDNEIQYFWDDLNAGVKTVEFTFRTARRGVYPVTPILAECMYEPEIFGRSDGYLYTIK